MRVDWKLAERSDEIVRYSLNMMTTGAIDFSEGEGVFQSLGNRSGGYGLFRLNTWMVSVQCPLKDQVAVELNKASDNPKSLKFVFDQGTTPQVEFTVKYTSGQSVTESFYNVTSLVIDGNQLSAEAKGTTYKPGNVIVTKPEPEEPEIDLDVKLAEALDKANKEHEAFRKKMNKQIAELNKQLQDERKSKAALQSVASSNLDQALAAAKAMRESLEQSLKERLAEIESVQRQASNLQTQADDAKELLATANERVAGIRAEKERLEQQLEEVETLDLDQAKADFEEVRARFGANDETLQLMATDEFLTGNSVSKTLETITKELESVERRIGLIIIYRESFLGSVQQSMANGDGVLPFDKDLERGFDGDCSESETKDQ